MLASCLLLAQLVTGTGAIAAPADPAAATAPASEQKLRVFLDFISYPDDPDFYRQELPFVDHVRTRQDAEVHVQVSFRWTGSGGGEITMRFLGRGRFEGDDFTLVHVSSPTDTSDLVRRALAHKIKLGLARFVAATPLGERLTLVYDEPATAQPSPDDPWGGWVFRTHVYGYFSGETRTDYANLYASASVSKVTEEWKYSASLSSSYDERTYRYSDLDENGDPVELRFTSIGRGHTAYARVVNSLGPRASVSVNGSVSRSTFTNEDLEVNGSGGLELSLWPYSESTSRLLVFRWWLGGRDIRYEEETIFRKTHERLVYESAYVGLRLTQPWGSVSTSVSGSHYMHDLSKNQASLNAALDVRLFRGLALNLDGTISLIRDQLYLPIGGASPEEILLQRKQLETDYQYWTSVGITYTFGSIFSNVVNPRFD